RYTLTNDWIDVGDLGSEIRHNYRWIDAEPLVGFPAEVHEFEYLDCYELCKVVDSGRNIDREESFDINGVVEGHDGRRLLITRLQPVDAGTFDVYVNDHFVATRWIPELQGHWLEVATPIPAA